MFAIKWLISHLFADKGTTNNAHMQEFCAKSLLFSLPPPEMSVEFLSRLMPRTIITYLAFARTITRRARVRELRVVECKVCLKSKK